MKVRELLALLVFPVVGFVWAVAYLVLLGRVLDRGSLALAAAIVVIPLLTLLCGIVWIMLLRIAAPRGRGDRSRGLRIGLAAAVALVFSLLLAGPGGFTMTPGAELINIFLLIAVSTSAMAYLELTFPP